MHLFVFCAIGCCSLLGALAGDDHNMPHAVAYDSDTFNAEIPHLPHFVMFYAPWFVESTAICRIICDYSVAQKSKPLSAISNEV